MAENFNPFGDGGPWGGDGPWGAPAPGDTLSPSLFSDEDTFFSATVAPGAVTVTPSLFSDDDTFYSSSINSLVTLAPSLFADSDTFFALSVYSRPNKRIAYARAEDRVVISPPDDLDTSEDKVAITLFDDRTVLAQRAVA